jgi:hypothetical protein
VCTTICRGSAHHSYADGYMFSQLCYIPLLLYKSRDEATQPGVTEAVQGATLQRWRTSQELQNSAFRIITRCCKVGQTCKNFILHAPTQDHEYTLIE